MRSSVHRAATETFWTGALASKVDVEYVKLEASRVAISNVTGVVTSLLRSLFAAASD